MNFIKPITTLNRIFPYNFFCGTKLFRRKMFVIKRIFLRILLIN